MFIVADLVSLKRIYKLWQVLMKGKIADCPVLKTVENKQN